MTCIKLIEQFCKPDVGWIGRTSSVRDANDHRSVTWDMHTRLGGGHKGIKLEPAVLSGQAV